MRLPYSFLRLCLISYSALLIVSTSVKADTPPEKFYALAEKYAQTHGLPSALVHAVIAVESGWRRDARNGSSIGLMQITPSTARALGYRGSTKDLYDPETNIRFGVQYLALAYERAGGDLCGTVSRYQSGIDAQKINAANRAYCVRAKNFMATYEGAIN
jgi:soluble lytic murein transglycosylase-like protein